MLHASCSIASCSCISNTKKEFELDACIYLCLVRLLSRSLLLPDVRVQLANSNIRTYTRFVIVFDQFITNVIIRKNARGRISPDNFIALRVCCGKTLAVSNVVQVHPISSGRQSRSSHNSYSSYMFTAGPIRSAAWGALQWAITMAESQVISYVECRLLPAGIII